MPIRGKNLREKVLALESELVDLKKRNRELEAMFSGEPLKLLNRVCESIAAGYFIFDPERQEIIFNGSLEALFANLVPSFPFTIEQFIQNVNGEDQEFLKEIFSPVKGQKRKATGQFRMTYRSKEIREMRTFSILTNQDETPGGKPQLFCVFRDITREMKQMRDLQKSLEKSEESDRIKTIFLLNISHNIRTPMNSILGFAELLHLTHPGPQQRNEYIQTIKRQSQNLLQLIDDVSEVAKFESGSMTITKTPVNLNLLINEVIRDLESQRNAARRENVKIYASTPNQSGLELFTDAGRLYQIFSNLISHSLRYTIQGYIELGYHLPEDGRVNFYVKDTSKNLDKNELKALFEKYTKIPESTLSRYDDDTRFNLTLARSIVKLLGGKISFDYDSETGGTFNFTLPYEEPPRTHPEIAEEELAFNTKYKWNDKVILLVEDEEVNGIFLEAVLTETGAHTLYAKNGRQAVDLVRSINKIDLILMDIKMPVMNGLKATQEIRKFNPGIPIIAQTALALEEDRDECLHAGCNDAITKPIEIEELLKLINKYFSL